MYGNYFGETGKKMRRIKEEEESMESGRTKFKEEVGETGKKRRRIKEKEESVERGRKKFKEEEILDNFTPTCLPKKLGYVGAGRPRFRSRSISRSGVSASGAGTGTTIYNNINGGMVDREATSGMVETKGAEQVVKIVCSMVDRGLIAANEMPEILDLVSGWFKERGVGVWWSFMVSSTPSLELKAQALKDELKAQALKDCLRG